MAGDDTVDVAFIGGTGRSGSTLISRVLGAVPGFCAVGELFHVWDHGVRRDELCGCGVRFGECDFWTRVGNEAFGGWDRVDAGEMLTLHRGVVRIRHLPLLAAPRLVPSFQRRLERYTAVMGRLYHGVRAVSGCDVVVDSSKLPGSAYTAWRVPGIQVKMIHLVRSSYGVCYSLTKRLPNPDYRHDLMPRQSPARSALEWSGFNLSLDVLGRLGMPSLLLRYEDFVAEPRAQLDRMLGFLGREAGPEQLAFLRDDRVDLARCHCIAGNPMRSRIGSEPLVTDVEWRARLPRRAKWLVAAITAGGLVRYGYYPPHAGSRRMTRL
ncbi:sulfotransferase [Sphaerisporangium aureirubrum]|uniref:Sulfotransferase n=1 Tax=Sphaerisporangium aureirubrum TaxID=1544736 RepID=A0ABW1NTV6_9ACTN